ncbi:MAG: 30S ribosomal protein S8 [Candidatus Woesearchaeota archaeon]
MTLNNPLASALSHTLNCDKIGRSEVLIKPISTTIKNVYKILNEELYVGSFDIVEDGRGDMLKVNLIGKINKCGVVSPKFAVKKDNFEKFEKRYLPASDFGILIVSTSKGIMIHKKAKELGIGGKLIAYCY